MKSLHWFRFDLRLDDNEALITAVEQSTQLVAVFVVEPKWFIKNAYDCVAMGKHRLAFLQSSLVDLRKRLKDVGVDLFVLQGDPVDLIPDFIKQNQIQHLSLEKHFGYNEVSQVNLLKQKLTNISFTQSNSHYLFKQDNLPFALPDMPNVFSPFRNKVEKYSDPRKPLEFPSKINVAPMEVKLEGMPIYEFGMPKDLDYIGGEKGAQLRIQDYFFETDSLQEYKQTRNGLDGWDFSSRLSAYLALGCVSPARVLEKIKEYEQSRIKNDSTYWLFFELLWREFFHWSHLKHGKDFFHFAGIQQKVPNTNHSDEKFNSWRQGKTGYAIVDACMRQLNTTGFMSNRGRQLVASCFVHELGLDWRYGAAFFEQQLIDFDVASNYGNWQYLAGVGSDPRGHRQFNLEKQTQTYDPDGHFIAKWKSK
ncbi:DASH family cryptochrome [Glaciecola sp. 1036]|uniref:DASH family cryptochrome n=1 Tax=Alteromonadaceae TaxID=72275 RepID=UPI003CFE7C18